MKADLFAELGFFDENYFAYSEDVDYCLRVRVHGWEILHNPRALVIHYPSSAVKRNKGKWFRDYYVTRNTLLLLRRQKQGISWFLFLGYFAVKYVAARTSYFLLTGQFRRIVAIVSGIRDFRRKKFGETYA